MKLIPETQDTRDTIDCRICRHYSFTSAEALPYRCRALDFSGRQSPGAVVFASAETPCRQFAAAKKAGAKP